MGKDQAQRRGWGKADWIGDGSARRFEAQPGVFQTPDHKFLTHRVLKKKEYICSAHHRHHCLRRVRCLRERRDYYVGGWPARSVQPAFKNHRTYCRDHRHLSCHHHRRRAGIIVILVGFPTAPSAVATQCTRIHMYIHATGWF